jgi:hypothetical protein
VRISATSPESDYPVLGLGNDPDERDADGGECAADEERRS